MGYAYFKVQLVSSNNFPKFLRESTLLLVPESSHCCPSSPTLHTDTFLNVSTPGISVMARIFFKNKVY